MMRFQILHQRKLHHSFGRFRTFCRESEEEANEEARAKFQAQMKSAWSRSIFFVLLAKVGLDEINSEYTPCIKELLSYPESVGMIGEKNLSFCSNLTLCDRWKTWKCILLRGVSKR